MCSRWLVVPFLLGLAAGVVAADEPSLERCAALVRDDPDELESYRCYWTLARGGEWAGSARALEALLAIDPSNHRARLYLAAIEADLGRERAEELYREAADGLAAMGEPTGEVYARIALSHFLKRADRKPEARAELERASGTASAADDPVLRARVWVARARLDAASGESGRALTLLRRAEDLAFPDGPIDLRSTILSALGFAYWEQGLYERALETYLRQADIVGGADLVYFEASARYNIALVSVELFQKGRLEFDDHLQHLESALELAVRVGNRRVEARSRLLLGQVLGGKRRFEEYERALEISRSVGHRTLAREVQRHLAFRIWHAEPERKEEALRLLDEVIEDARVSADLRNHAYTLLARAIMLSDSGVREDWIDAYERAIDAAEKIRDLQPDGTVGARLSSPWAYSYLQFSGKLLDGLSRSPDPAGDLERAFRTVERMRSRALIDKLDSAGAHRPYAPDHPDTRRREEVLVEIAGVQKRLADPSLPADERASSLETLERLEMEEVALRGEIARADPAFAAHHAPVLPGLREIRDRLAPDQAILSYQLHPDRPSTDPPVRGSSWVVLITRDGASAFPLPETRVMKKRVSAFVGLCLRRDGSEAEAAGVLFDDLLGEPLRAAGPEVRRLVIVPDDTLHRLPFAALRPGAGGEPLGATHAISRVPSVTAWMRWQDAEIEDARAPGASSVLALADPELGGVTADDALRSADPWLGGLRLGPLPHARSEARRMVRAIGGASRLLSGPEASERVLKDSDLGRFRILHFAAHAVIDHDRPERSAVVLAPGGEAEDGFLQMREIVDLDLRGKVVILSACQSASGTILEGEGVQGLARAFFQAGARAVVGSLWPMRDDEAEALMGDLARRIARGENLSHAVAGVRASQFGRGAPAEAWATLVVLGDGSFAPVTEGRKRFSWLLPVLGVLFLLAIGIPLYRRLRG